MGSRNAPKKSAKPRPAPTASVVPTEAQKKAQEEETEDFTILVKIEKHIGFELFIQDWLQTDLRPHYAGEKLERSQFKVIRNIKNISILALIWKETMASVQVKAAAGIDQVSLKGHVCINQIATMLCEQERQREWKAAGNAGKPPSPSKQELQSYVMQVRRVVEAARDYGLITKAEKNKTAIPLQGTARLRELMKVFLFSEAGDRGPGGC